MNVLKSVLTIGALMAGAGVAASCGSGSDSADQPSGANSVVVSDSWARTSPAMSTVGVVYFGLRSTDGDELVGVSVAGTIAAEAQIHETISMDHDASADATSMDHDEMATDEMATDEMATDEMATDEMEMDLGQMMSMSQVSAVDLPAGEKVVFAPGGHHVMLMDLVGPLETDASFELTLHFAGSEAQTITVRVSDAAP